MKKRIVIGGCRDYNDYSEFYAVTKRYISQVCDEHEIIILSGHCSGVDAMAERYAEQENIELEIYSADWRRYGRAAGPIRNKLMVENADFVIAFWDGESRGTKSLIEWADKLGRTVHIHKIKYKGC